MRRWLVVLVGCLVLAVGIPTVWFATRPDASTGPSVASVVGRSAAPTTSPAQPAPSSAGPAVSARPATVPAPEQRPGPAEIRITGIDVNAPVVPVGVRPDGSMAIPVDVRKVGWYRFGPQPGDPAGATVLAGHVDSKEQGRGAMFRIRELEPGDRLELRTEDGRRLAYKVVAKETIVKKRLPTERLFARDGPPRLVLITCGGPFLPQLSSYRDNLVVVAEPTDGGS